MMSLSLLFTGTSDEVASGGVPVIPGPLDRRPGSAQAITTAADADGPDTSLDYQPESGIALHQMPF